jgi:predicted AAA+ superfamily ATPase
MVNPRKAYPIDPGLIPVFDRSGKTNLGHALETVLALELQRRGAEIAYVRTRKKFEVDFLARYPDGKRELIQVCADPGNQETLERETRALVAAAQELRQVSLHLVPRSNKVPLSFQLRRNDAGAAISI